MLDIFSITDTYTLLSAVEQIKKPASYLSETFFPKKDFFATTYVGVEYRKEERTLAPAIVKGGRGVNVNRGSSQARYYSAPIFGPRRVIGLKELEMRQFGEVTQIYSAVKPEDRLARMQAQDLTDLLRLHANRKEQMASSLLQTGKFEVKGYADDVATPEVDVIDFELDCEVYPAKSWTDPTATIYSDLMSCSMKIQEQTGLIPNVLICGKGVEEQLLGNKEIRDWLLIPNRESLNMAAFSPKFTAPNARFIGYIAALNLEVVSYLDTYIGEDGRVHSFIDANTAILGNVGQGRQLFGTVSLFMETGVQTFSAEHIPQYTYSQDAQQYALTVYSRYILAPSVFGDWLCIRTEGAD